MTDQKILEFKNEYAFLSNFYSSPFIINNINFPTNEHFYQANKTINRDEFQYVLDSDTPAIAKKRGKEINIDPNWNNIKNRIMFIGVYNKFIQNNKLKFMLINTGNAELIEGNYWNQLPPLKKEA
ncbi:NADAR family protein [Candidatus Pacearchaeota archaeon]|nr:NADAR family protein [Candidatus Pacearchaeota archaeon]